jgi:hypothetical protein
MALAVITGSHINYVIPGLQGFPPLTVMGANLKAQFYLLKDQKVLGTKTGYGLFKFGLA